MQWREFKENIFEKVYRNTVYPITYLTKPEPIVFVYTMQKTGTNTLRFTLYRHARQPVFYVHYLNSSVTNIEQFDLKSLFKKKKGFQYFMFWGDFVHSCYIQKKRKIKIITSMRELVGRDISLFFQSFHHQYDQDELLQKFNDGYVAQQTENTWFQDETHQSLGINIFDYPFPHEQGYQIIKNDAVELLLMRIETPDSVKEYALSEFLGVPNIKLYRANIGVNKSYASIYQQFKQNLQLPSNYIDFHYQSKLMNYFYTEAEIEQFRTHWNILD
jgi:hypothetical protein